MTAHQEMAGVLERYGQLLESGASESECISWYSISEAMFRYYRGDGKVSEEESLRNIANRLTSIMERQLETNDRLERKLADHEQRIDRIDYYIERIDAFIVEQREMNADLKRMWEDYTKWNRGEDGRG